MKVCWGLADPGPIWLIHKALARGLSALYTDLSLELFEYLPHMAADFVQSE